LGEIVRELVNTDMNSGVHTVQWNSEDVSGKKVSSGIYFYELVANGVNGNKFNQVRKMILMK
jgi:flagellar hook assembly protein FlgD